MAQREATPTWRLPGIGQLLLHCLNSGIHVVAMYWRKVIGIMSIPLRACRPRLTAAQGSRVAQRAILARTPQKIRNRAKAVPRPQRAADITNNTEANLIPSVPFA